MDVTMVETEETIMEETYMTGVETVEMKETTMEETHTMDTKEIDLMDAMDVTETGVFTIPLVTSNDMWGLPHSVRR